MGDNIKYKVNDDGSVTVEGQRSEHGQNIVEIFRIERSKGGLFASRRMKKRALKYAKSVNYPEFKVEKLMLDNYPVEFANYSRTTKLILLLFVATLFFAVAIIFGSFSYFEFNHVLWDWEHYGVEFYDASCFGDMMWFFLCCVICFAIVIVSLIRYRRISKQINLKVDLQK